MGSHLAECSSFVSSVSFSACISSMSLSKYQEQFSIKRCLSVQLVFELLISKKVFHGKNGSCFSEKLVEKKKSQAPKSLVIQEKFFSFFFFKNPWEPNHSFISVPFSLIGCFRLLETSSAHPGPRPPDLHQPAPRDLVGMNSSDVLDETDDQWSEISTPRYSFTWA